MDVGFVGRWNRHADIAGLLIQCQSVGLAFFLFFFPKRANKESYKNTIYFLFPRKKKKK